MTSARSRGIRRDCLRGGTSFDRRQARNYLLQSIGVGLPTPWNPAADDKFALAVPVTHLYRGISRSSRAARLGAAAVDAMALCWPGTRRPVRNQVYSLATSENRLRGGSGFIQPPPDASARVSRGWGAGNHQAPATNRCSLGRRPPSPSKSQAKHVVLSMAL